MERGGAGTYNNLYVILLFIKLKLYCKLKFHFPISNEFIESTNTGGYSYTVKITNGINIKYLNGILKNSSKLRY